MCEPVNDIVCSILQTPFSRWNDDDQMDVLTCERPTPHLDFSAEVKSIGMYNIKFTTAWYQTYKWLCGSSYYKRLYCWPCLLLGNKRTKWNFEGYWGLLDMEGAFKRHNHSVEHDQCVKELENLRKNMNPNFSSSPRVTIFSADPTNVSEPVNDIVCNLLEKPFIKWNDKERADVLAHGRPTPFLDLSHKELTKLGKSSNINFRSSWYEMYDWLCGSFYMKRLYCWPCLLVGFKKLAWSFNGFCYLKNVNTCAINHSKSLDHVASVQRLKNLRKILEREIEDCVKQQGLDKSLECKKDVESSSEVAELPTLWESDMHNNRFKINDASNSAIHCGEPEEFENEMVLVKQELPDVEDDNDISLCSSDFVRDENADEEGRQTLNDEPRRPLPFVDAQTKLESVDIVKEVIERGDRVSLPIREPVPLNHQDKAYDLPCVPCEENEILQRPEFIPVEDDNLKSAANELQNDEPRRPFPHVEVQVKLEPVDIVQEECDAENGLDMETDPSNRKDEPYELTSVKCEVDEEILQRPEFIPVERDDDLESGATRLQTLRLNIEERVAIVIWQIQGKEYNEIKTEFERRFKKTGPLDKTVDYLLNKFRRTGSVHDEIKSEHLHTSKDNVNAVLSEASFSGEDDSDNSSSWGEDMIPAPGACVMFVRCNSAGDRVEGSEVLSENKLLRVLQKRRRGREGKRRCRKRHTPESEQRYLHRNQENINNTQEGISPEYQGKFVKEKQEREKRRKADEADHQRPKHEREKLRKADEQIWMRPEKKRIRLDVRGTTSGSVTCGESMNLEQS